MTMNSNETRQKAKRSLPADRQHMQLYEKSSRGKLLKEIYKQSTDIQFSVDPKSKCQSRVVDKNKKKWKSKHVACASCCCIHQRGI